MIDRPQDMRPETVSEEGLSAAELKKLRKKQKKQQEKEAQAKEVEANKKVRFFDISDNVLLSWYNDNVFLVRLRNFFLILEGRGCERSNEH